MRNIFKTFAAAIMLLFMPLAMTACSAPQVAPESIQAAAQMNYTKAMYAAEAGFKGVSVALETAVDSGQLKGEAAAKALKAYDNIKAALDKARTSKQQADALLAQSYIADLWSALTSFSL